jgi:hypothetical protein
MSDVSEGIQEQEVVKTFGVPLRKTATWAESWTFPLNYSKTLFMSDGCHGQCDNPWRK